MRVLFYTTHCNPCQKVKWAVEMANLKLPVGYKVDMVNAHGGDPRTKVLAEIYGTTDPNRWILPVIIFDRPVVKRRIGITVKDTQRVVIHGFQGTTHLTSLLNRLI